MKPGDEPHRGIDSIAVCNHCWNEAHDSGDRVDVGVCFNCGRWACTCLLSKYPVEGETEQKLWCAGRVRGGSDADGKTQDEDELHEDDVK